MSTYSASNLVLPTINKIKLQIQKEHFLHVFIKKNQYQY